MNKLDGLKLDAIKHADLICELERLTSDVEGNGGRRTYKTRDRAKPQIKVR